MVTETTRFKTTRPGSIHYRIKTMGGLVVKTGMVEAKRNGNEYVATVIRKLLPFNQPYEGQFMAEAIGTPQANTGWMKLKVTCLKMLSSKLTISDPKNNGQNQCPRQGAVNAVMIFNEPGQAKVRINCTNGFSKTSTVVAKKNILAGDYRATAYHYFDVEKHGNISCFLQDADHNYKLLSLASKEFSCIKRNVDSGSDNLAPDTADDPTTPFPVRKLKGDFTFLDNTGTKCTREGKALISFVTPKPAPQGDVHWKLNCTNGKVMTGIAKSVKVGPNKYVATAMARFNIKKTSTYSCGLNSSAPGPVKGHTYKSHKFRCIKRVWPTGPRQISRPKQPKRPVYVRPVRPVNDYKAPICTTKWKTKCTRKPVKKCRKKSSLSCKPVVKRQCKTVTGRKCNVVAKRSCSNKVTRSCKRKQVRECKRFRGKLSCKTVWKTQCKPKIVKTCKVKKVRQCRPTVKRVCTKKVTKKCQRKTAIKCETEWKKSCKREKVVSCRR